MGFPFFENELVSHSTTAVGVSYIVWVGVNKRFGEVGPFKFGSCMTEFVSCLCFETRHPRRSSSASS